MTTDSIARGGTPFTVTHAMVLRIAVPMTLAFLTTPLLGIVDMAVVGRFDDPAMLAGLAAGAVIIDICFTTFNFLRMGTTGLVAQANGRGDALEEQAVLWRALIIAAVAGLALSLLAGLAAWAGEAFIAPAPAVGDALRVYVAIRFLGAPLSLANYALLGYFLGRGEAMLGLMMQLFLNLTHILLSIVLGFWLGWGLEGIAWGTVGGEACGLLLGLAIVARRLASLARPQWRQVLDRASFAAMLALNRDIMIRTFALLGAFALFAREGAQLGTVIMAANAVLMNLFFVASYFLDGFANAAEQIVGRAVGARYAPAMLRAVRLTTLWGFLLAAVAGLILVPLGPLFIEFISKTPAVQEEAVRYLLWAAFFSLSGVLAFQMDGVFIGATWSRTMRNRMVFALVVFVVAVFTLKPVFGNHGLWAALHIFLLARGLSLLAALPGKMRETFPEDPSGQGTARPLVDAGVAQRLQ